jgi:hypothetical protein
MNQSFTHNKSSHGRFRGASKTSKNSRLCEPRGTFTAQWLRLIDDTVFKKSQTYELQSLGIVFGDVLASELPLRWVMITDEYGT